MTTATADDVRAQLLTLLSAGRDYDFLQAGEACLAQLPDDTELALRVVQAYLRLGLSAAAAGWVDRLMAEDRLPGQLDDIRNAVSRVTQAYESEERRGQRFARNLAALTDRGIDVAPLEDAWRAARHTFEFPVDARGVCQVRRRTGDGWRWFPMIGDHPALAAQRQLPIDPGALQPGPFAFDGLGLGHFIDRVYDATLDTFLGYSCPLVIVEPEPTWVALALQLCDLAECLRDRRVRLLFGPSWERELRTIFRENPNLPLPITVFHLSPFRPATVPTAAEVIEAAARERESQLVDLVQRGDVHYAGRDAKYWSRRFEEALQGGEPPLRILAVVSRHTTFLQYSMRDLLAAAGRAGCEVRLLIEDRDDEVIGPLPQRRAIVDFKPDVFLVLDHVRAEFGAILPPNLPVLTWDQDHLPHVVTRENVTRMAPIDFFAGFGSRACRSFGIDEQQAVPAGIPTSRERFEHAPLTAEEQARFACDVSYVSHASQTPAAFHAEERNRLADPHVRRLLDLLYERLPERLSQHGTAHGRLAFALVDEATEDCGIGRLDRDFRLRLVTWYLWRLGDRLFRHQALEWVAAWALQNGRCFRIYGNGWDRHPTLANYAAGPVENDRELVCVCRASRINLQLMPAGFIHQRALDGIASGGFFLSRETFGDLHAPIVRRLHAAIEAGDITQDDDLLAHPDAGIQNDLDAWLGEFRNRVAPGGTELIDQLRDAAETPSARTEFPGFDELTFHDAGTFKARADRYIDDDAARSAVVSAMQKVVAEKFTYDHTIRALLRGHADWLKRQASRCARGVTHD